MPSSYDVTEAATSAKSASSSAQRCRDTPILGWLDLQMEPAPPRTPQVSTGKRCSERNAATCESAWSLIPRGTTKSSGYVGDKRNPRFTVVTRHGLGLATRLASALGDASSTPCRTSSCSASNTPQPTSNSDESLWSNAKMNRAWPSFGKAIVCKSSEARSASVPA